MAQCGTYLVRIAAEYDLKVVTRLGVFEDWGFNPHELATVYTFNPSGFIVGELDGEVIGHINAVNYPGHSTCIGTFIVKKELRRKGFGKQIWDTAWKSVDHRYTVTLNGVPDMIPLYKSLGFHSMWNTSAAIVDLQKVMLSYNDLVVPFGVSYKPIRSVDFEILFKYDMLVYGAPRRELLKNWINLPGSLGWAAVNERGDVIGYTTVKQVISGAGTEIGLSMTPLYADDDITARLLLKVAASAYLGIEAVANSSFELYYSDGGRFGDHALRLMVELEAEMFYVGQKMYTKGIPPGQQLQTMYALFSTAYA